MREELNKIRDLMYRFDNEATEILVKVLEEALKPDPLLAECVEAIKMLNRGIYEADQMLMACLNYDISPCYEDRMQWASEYVRWGQVKWPEILARYEGKPEEGE